MFLNEHLLPKESKNVTNYYILGNKTQLKQWNLNMFRTVS